MRCLCIDLTKPEWWSVILSAVSAIAVIVIAVVQIRLQRQQMKQQEYELYRKIFAYIWELDFFNKTMLHRIVALLASNEDKDLRLKLITDVWNEYEKRSDEFTECTIDIELKQCGEGLDVKYYYDALQASRKVILMFKYFIEDNLLIFDPSLAHNPQIENHNTPPEVFIDIILKLFRGRNPLLLRNELLAFASIVKKTDQAHILEIIKERITPTNTK